MDKTTHEVRIANWRSIIKQCQARPEGQSAKQWLADNGINEKSYYYWQRKVRKETYAQKFNEEGYATHDCSTIVKVMDAIYHAFNITMDEAYVVTQYAVDNHLTLTQAILDRFNVNFNEIEEFIDTVLPEIVKYFESRTKKYGKELAAIVDQVLSLLE